MEIMMKWLKKLMRIKFILITCICIILWFITPHINSGDYILKNYYLRSFIVLLILTIFFKNEIFDNFLMKNTLNTKIIVNLVSSILSILKRIASLKVITASLKNKSFSSKIKRNACYIIVGHEKSGKKSLLENSELIFLKDSELNEEMLNCLKISPEIEWKFTIDTIFIQPKIIETKTQYELIQFLKKRNSSHPLNGVIITIKLISLLIEEQTINQINIFTLTHFLKKLHRDLKITVPIYIYFTQCDLIEGFSEFFDHLITKNGIQGLGATLPLGTFMEVEAVIEFIEKSYVNILEYLQQNILSALSSEKKQHVRDKLASFPQQMQLFIKPIITNMRLLLSAPDLIQALQFRGYYFSSATQQGTPLNLLNIIVGSRFGIIHQASNQQRPAKRGYFIASIFNEVIFQEAIFLGKNQSRLTLKKMTYNIVCLLTPLLIGLTAYGFHSSYNSLKNTTIKVNEYINNYKLYKYKIKSADLSFTDVFSALNSLKKAKYEFYHTSFLEDLLFSHYQLQQETEQAYLRAIDDLFYPRIAANLEFSLRQTASSPNILYALLKGYLAFSPSNYTSPKSVITPIKYLATNEMKLNNSDQKQLNFYLNNFTDQRMIELPIDQNLVDHIRNIIQKITPDERAYSVLLLRAETTDFPDLELKPELGLNFEKIFKLPVEKIPKLYTIKGYKEIFLKQAPSIALQVAQDNLEIGLINSYGIRRNAVQILNQLKITYSENYIKTWSNFLRSIKINDCKNIQTMMAQLDLLSQSSSPLTTLFKLVNNQTSPLYDDNITIASYFSTLNQYTQGIHENSYQQLKLSFYKLNVYFQNISQNSSLYEPEFYTLRNLFNDSPEKPLLNMFNLIDLAPESLQPLFQSISTSYFKTLSNDSLKYLNIVWSNKIINEFYQNIQDRYPVSPYSATDISPNSFVEFFAPHGSLDNFFNQYIRIFLNIQPNSWILKKINRFEVPLTLQSLAFFQRYQKIKDNYFKNDNLQFTFTIKPLFLDSNASGIDLTFGIHDLNYRHGPQIPLSLVWPFTDVDNDIKISISDFYGEKYLMEFSGPWSLFRFFDVCNIQKTQPDSYLVRLIIGKYNFSFAIQSQNANMIELPDFKNFNLPVQLEKNIE